jgi:hypothetical protein
MAYSVPESSVIDYGPESLNSFSLYGYEWIDNLHFTLAATKFVADPEPYLTVVRQRFLEAGWDGDGEIDLIWLPPFVFPLELKITPVGVVVWHVKQLEDGISWLLSPVPLPFAEFSGRVA